MLWILRLKHSPLAVLLMYPMPSPSMACLVISSIALKTVFTYLNTSAYHYCYN